MRGASISFGRPALALLVLGLAASGGFAIYTAASGKLTAFIPDFFASPGGDMDLGSDIQPRGTVPAAPGASDTGPALAEMPALVETDSSDNAPASWPDLGPGALLEQAAAIPDRALKDSAFDLPPWRRYARPFTATDRPLLGILVTGLGLDRAVTAAAIAGLPAEVSLSFSAYAPDLADWIAAARAFGHEALIDLPMQGKDFPAHDPGPLGLVLGLNGGETARRIDAVADSGDRAIGFVSDRGQALLLDDGATALVLDEIHRLGRAFIETEAEPMSRAASNATAIGVAFARTTGRLDEIASRTAITEQLAVAAQRATRQQRALTIARATPVSILAIAEWERRRNAQGPVLAPASALLNP